VRLAHQFHMVNPLIRADAVRWALFKAQADAHRITGVPALVINGSQLITEELDEAGLLRVVLAAAGVK